MPKFFTKLNAKAKLFSERFDESEGCLCFRCKLDE